MTLPLRRLEASLVAVVLAAFAAGASAANGLCNAEPLLPPSIVALHKTLSAAQFAAKLAADPPLVDGWACFSAAPPDALEGVPLYAAAANADGTCPTWRVALYRIWRPFGDSNHRFTTERSVVAAMVARGCVDEGAAMCVLPSS